MDIENEQTLPADSVKKKELEVKNKKSASQEGKTLSDFEVKSDTIEKPQIINRIVVGRDPKGKPLILLQ